MKDEHVVHFWWVCMSMLVRKTRKTQQYKITIARNTLITKKLWQQENDEDAVPADDDDAIIDYQQMCVVMVSCDRSFPFWGILDNFSLAHFFFLFCSNALYYCSWKLLWWIILVCPTFSSLKHSKYFNLPDSIVLYEELKVFHVSR